MQELETHRYDIKKWNQNGVLTLQPVQTILCAQANKVLTSTLKNKQCNHKIQNFTILAMSSKFKNVLTTIISNMGEVNSSKNT
jgi:hypothetical protein